MTGIDFDYSGPPVTVSNGMALDLVSQFGLQNAWYAVVKLRGLSPLREEPERALALKRFRNKVRRLKKTAETLKGRADDTSNFLAKELSLESGAKRAGEGASGAGSASDGESDPQGENGADADIGADGDGEDGPPIAIPTTSSIMQVISKGKEVVAAAAAAMGKQTSKEPAPESSANAKRNQETIDDVVSSIMDKIHNNLPFEGELISSSSAQPGPSRAPKKPVAGKGSKAPAAPAPPQKKGRGKAAAVPDHVTITSNYSEIIRTAGPQQRMGILTQPGAQGPGAQMSAHQIPISAINFPYGVPLTVGGLSGQPIQLQGNVTVQALLQSFQQQQQHAKHMQMTQRPNLHYQQHQETLPDSSSGGHDGGGAANQQAGQFAPQAPAAGPKKRASKKKAAPVVINAPEPVKPEEPAKATHIKKAPLVKRAPIGKGAQPAAAAAAAAFEAERDALQRANEDAQKRVAELEAQLAKTQRQTTSERNKGGAQKKRLEKVQADLEKSMDAIQLVQIDLACQKTDNNNLIAENIALKAEIQQLRSKDNGAKGKQKPSTSAAAASGARPGAKRKAADTPQSSSAAAAPVPSSPPAFPEEYGRRQSKRICVSRSRFLYGMF